MSVTTLVEIFKEIDNEMDQNRMIRLVENFNKGMKELGRLQQLEVVRELVDLGLMDGDVYIHLEISGGSFAGYGYNYRKIALEILSKIDLKEYQFLPKQILDKVAFEVKHLGLVSSDFYETMKVVRKILKIT